MTTNTSHQLPSKYMKPGMEVLDRTLVAQVHFAYNERELDTYDRHVLDKLVRDYKAVLAQSTPSKGSLNFHVVGHTDLRGKSAYNQRLALHRAQAVEKYLDQRLQHKSCFTEAMSQGEIKATGKHAFDRRVNIFRVIQAPKTKTIRLPPVKVRGIRPPEYTQIGFWVSGNYIDIGVYKNMKLYLYARFNDAQHLAWVWYTRIHAIGLNVPKE